MNFHRLKGYGNASLDATVAKRRERGYKSGRDMAATLVVALSTGRRLPPVRVIRVRVPLEALRRTIGRVLRLLDMKLPDGSGIDLLKAVKANATSAPAITI